MEIDWNEEINTCFDCPLKWSCALWLNDAWNVNKPLCDCVDDRLICGIDETRLMPERIDLLKLFKKGIDTVDIL